ncbi:MAG TPA: SDR family oxidoreductase [Candidatus Methylacidiphilales bacterium]|jgi:nucleoside-diphosphate-sugar epimerase|nr:SDR family oxidoreductase [Candidatus Methylacidiphilales bacterium]
MSAYHPSRVALTGATGALGFALLQRFFQHDPNLQATLLVRKTSSAFQAEAFQAWLRANEARIILVEGDVREIGPAQLDPLRACDGGLWHFAAVTSLTAESEEVARQIQEVNIEGTQRLADAWSGGTAAGPFYHVSTAYVVGDRHGTALETESAVGQNFRNPYEASKLAAETRVLKDFSLGLNGAIFRPSVVVDDVGGTGGFKMVDACAYAVALAVKRGEPFVFRMKHDANLNLVHSDWVIAAMADLARLPSGAGRTYHLTAHRDTYLRDIGVLLGTLVPNLKISFEPGLTRADLPSASKIFDKAATEVRPYLDADVHFDRTNTDRDLSPGTGSEAMDLAPFVESRLRSEMVRVAHRR